ncbi:hypothetical protein [Haloquadratum walsbyi]|nr:hypothetical protein [Haloquadratum walsbyi]
MNDLWAEEIFARLHTHRLGVQSYRWHDNLMRHHLSSYAGV